MKSIIRLTLPLLLVLLVSVSCSTPSATGHKTTGNATAKTADSTFILRAALSRQQQRDYDKLYLEAICQKLKGNTDAAHELLRHALDINPHASEALYEMAILQLENIRPSAFNTKEDSTAIAAAYGMLKRAYELEPSNPYYRSTLAKSYLQRYDLEEATKLYKLMAEEKPTEENLTILYRLYDTLADNDNALHTLSHMENMMGYNEEIAVGRYRIYDRQGKQTEAFAAIERLCDEHPNEMQYRSMLADVCAEQGDSAKAIALYREVLENDPTELNAYNGILVNYLVQKQMEEFNSFLSQFLLSENIDSDSKFSLLKSYAIAVAQQQITLQPKDMLLHFNEALSASQEPEELSNLCMAFIEATSGRLEKSDIQAAGRAVLQASPDNYTARMSVLLQLIEQEDKEAIRELCHEGTLLHPSELTFYFYEAMALREMNRNIESIEAFQRGAAVITEETDKDIASDFYAMLGDTFHDEGLTAEAFGAYDDALAFNPDNTMCLNNFAYFLALEGQDLDKALSLIKRAIEQRPDDPNLLDTYAWVLYQKGQYTLAKINIDQMLKNMPEEELLSPSADNLYDHAGDIYYKCGETEQAKAFWDKARSITNDQELIQTLNKKIKGQSKK